MTINDVKTIFLQDIGEPYATNERLLFLEAAVDGAIADITQAGVVLTTEQSTGGISAGDANLIRMYAAWLVRGRASANPMPPQLRFALYNKLFAQKMRAPETTSTEETP